MAMKKLGSDAGYAEEYQAELKKEIESRVREMEAEDYKFENKFSSLNYALAIGVSVVSLILLIIGAFY